MTVQGPVKKQQPDGMSHKGAGHPPTPCAGGPPCPRCAGPCPVPLPSPLPPSQWMEEGMQIPPTASGPPPPLAQAPAPLPSDAWPHSGPPPRAPPLATPTPPLPQGPAVISTAPPAAVPAAPAPEEKKEEPPAPTKTLYAPPHMQARVIGMKAAQKVRGLKGGVGGALLLQPPPDLHTARGWAFCWRVDCSA